jgi:hypothetical protein
MFLKKFIILTFAIGTAALHPQVTAAQDTLTIELFSGQGPFYSEDPIVSYSLTGFPPFHPGIIYSTGSVQPIPGAKPVSTDSAGGTTICTATFRVEFDLPPLYTDPFLNLTLAVDDRAEVFLNDVFIGVNPYGGSRSTVNTTDPSLFHPGENVLSFEVENKKCPTCVCPFEILAVLFAAQIRYVPGPPCDPVEPPEQRTQGYWRRQCKDRPHEDICALVDSVQILSDYFNGFSCSDVCNLMNVSPPENDMCRKAERQFMALLLNIASGKLSICNCLRDGRRVEEVISEIESLLGSVSPDHATCERAKTLADDINTGEALVDCGSLLKRESDVGDRDELFFSVPNPFSKSTLIQYRVLPVEDRDPERRISGEWNSPVPVKLKIFDVTGRLVKVLVDSEQAAGSYEITWDGMDRRGEMAGNGIYFYRLVIGTSHNTGKIILLQ